MKKSIILFFVLAAASLAAQNKIPISAGYFAPYVLQPGIKIGSAFDLQKRTVEKPNGTVKTKTWFVQPQVGYAVQPKVQSHFLINADLSYSVRKSSRKFFSFPSLGLGFMFTGKRLTSSVNLGTGDVSKKDSETQISFLPTLNYELGSFINSKFAWFIKFSYGRKFIFGNENAGYFAIDLGAKYHH